ncbi:MAG TPA: Holliday junction branch migration protein RuvA [Bacteroidetes bacterium]|jgi:holliday junction DNA helicase RuvA|nr:Holliday junction branch migration protein RuvA [Bacteroidota bacterium]
MIASMRGTLVVKSPTEVVIDTQGIGYSLNIPLSTFAALGTVGSTVTLLTYLHVREDVLQLFGFASDEERNIFKLLISVSGIGPRMGQTILSGIAVPDLKHHIISGNLGALTTIPGVGKKLAERLIFELRDKIGKVELSGALSPAPPDEQSQIRSEALLALTSLGYSRPMAEKALLAALKDANGKDATVEQLIRASLRHATKS